MRLLRVLQTREIERVGGSSTITVDARVVAATNRDLEATVAEGHFRKDLWFRLNVFPITVPPLRERRADIPALVQHFIDAKARRLKLEAVPRLVPGALEPLMGYDWPGNVRELENVVERALILCRDGELSFDRWIPTTADGVAAPAGRTPDDDEPLKLDKVVARHIRRVLERTGGKVHGPDGAAQVLGINASKLRNRMKKLGIPFGRLRYSPSR